MNRSHSCGGPLGLHSSEEVHGWDRWDTLKHRKLLDFSVLYIISIVRLLQLSATLGTASSGHIERTSSCWYYSLCGKYKMRNPRVYAPDVPSFSDSCLSALCGGARISNLRVLLTPHSVVILNYVLGYIDISILSYHPHFLADRQH